MNKLTSQSFLTIPMHDNSNLFSDPSSKELVDKQLSTFQKRLINNDISGFDIFDDEDDFDTSKKEVETGDEDPTFNVKDSDLNTFIESLHNKVYVSKISDCYRTRDIDEIRKVLPTSINYEYFKTCFTNPVDPEKHNINLSEYTGEAPYIVTPEGLEVLFWLEQGYIKESDISRTRNPTQMSSNHDYAKNDFTIKPMKMDILSDMTITDPQEDIYYTHPFTRYFHFHNIVERNMYVDPKVKEDQNFDMVKHYVHKQEEASKYVHPLSKWWSLKEIHAYLQLTPRRIFLMCFLAIWLTVLWTTIVLKNIYDDFLDVVEYFTNISYIIQTIFYSLYFFVFFENPAHRSLERFLLVCVFWVVFAQILAVNIMVYGVLLDDASIVVSEMKSAGGDYDDGVVLVVEKLFHNVPVICALIFLFLIWTDIADCYISVFGLQKYTFPKLVNGLLTNVPSRHMRNAYELLIQTTKYFVFKPIIVKEWKRMYYVGLFILCLVPFTAYYFAVDVQEQYGISDSLSTYVPFLALIGIITLVVMVPLWFMFNYTIPSKLLTMGALDGKSCMSEVQEKISGKKTKSEISDLGMPMPS